MKVFTSLLLDINDMSEEEKLFNFFTGLKPWAQIKVRRQGGKDLSTAIAYAKALVGYLDASISDLEEISQSKKKSERRKDFHRVNHTMKAPNVEKTREEKVETRREVSTTKSSGCFICERPH